MPSQMSKVVEQLRKAVLLQDGAGLTDGQLLECFIEHREQAAFTALVQRHGPMVWAVCRRLLNHHDAEDAFQATFLVLVRKAASVEPKEMVASWLYGVAHKTALQARRTAARRSAKEKQVVEVLERAAAEKQLWHDLQPLLDTELSRLPVKYRAVVVLSDLEGKTRTEVARQLGVPEGTVAGRLARARGMLAERLARRGLVVSSGSLAVVLSQSAGSASVPLSLPVSTIKAASLYAADQAVAAGLISLEVAALTRGVLTTMLLTQLRFVGVVLLIGGILATGTSVSTHFLSAQTNRTEQAVRTSSKMPEKDVSKTNRAANPTVKQDKGQPPDDSKAQALPKDPPTTPVPIGKMIPASVQRIRDTLAKPVSLENGIPVNTTLREAMECLSSNYDVPILFDTQAFKDKGIDVVEDTPVKLSKMIGIRLETILRLLLDQVNGTYLIRTGYIEVVPCERAQPEYWRKVRSLAPRVNVNFTERALDGALRELADQSGISVVIDTRARERATTNVTAALNSVPIDTAVLILAEMADLRLVVLDNVLFVTTKENAEQLAIWHDKQTKQLQTTPAECKPDAAIKPK
jgi:RNA polymerase sigma factor (sigma-70 family)